nr:hypothetical protein [Tanacetum cinerariifolium]
MQHPVDGRAYKDFDTKYSNFAAEPRNVRLRSLIDDLKDLWAKPGVETIDVATGLKFNMRAMVLWTINDFPAQSSLSGWSGQGYKACPTCNEDTPSVRVLGHKWRRSLEFNGETENGDPPREFSQDAIMTQLARLPTHAKDVMHIEKNVLESILNTLLMNDKSKDTTKARQDLKRLGIRSGLCLSQNKNGKCSKPQAAYSFTPGDIKKFCQFIKGVKLPDGFGSNFKHKQYLAPDVAKPLIELCLFFKQICSQILMVDDMLKAQSKDVTMKINRPDRNVDCPLPTCQLQVFKSLCKSIGLRSVIRIDHQELKKVIWYVLHNSPEIDTYRAKFKIEFPNKDMK